MSEINESVKTRQRGIVKKRVTKSTRVDLTPMVDLGFILVTFFVFTTTMAQPKAMKIVVPNDSEINKTSVCESCALTFLPGRNDELYYYTGSVETAKITKTNYTPEGLRNLLLQEKNRVTELRGIDQLQVIVKPLKESNLKNFVNIMDELNICLVKRYFIDEPTKKDIKIILYDKL